MKFYGGYFYENLLGNSKFGESRTEISDTIWRPKYVLLLSATQIHNRSIFVHHSALLLLTVAWSSTVHTEGICCVSIAVVVMRTRNRVQQYLHCLCCLFHLCLPSSFLPFFFAFLIGSLFILRSSLSLYLSSVIVFLPAIIMPHPRN
jgi:hypothetical protein